MGGVGLSADWRPGSRLLDHASVLIREAYRRVEALEVEARPYRITTKLIQELIDQMTGLLDHAPLETRVAWARTCSSELTSTASSNARWLGGGRQPIRMLTGWNQ